MADLRESFPILENSGTQAGEPLHKVLEGDAATGKNALAALTVKDSSGNLQYLTLNAAGQLPVSLDAATSCKSARGTAVGNTSLTTVATIVLTNGKKYKDVDWSVACLRDAVYEIAYIIDVGGAATTRIIADIIVGAGAYTHAGELSCEAFTVPGTLINQLVLRAKNFNATSDFRGSFSISEIA